MNKLYVFGHTKPDTDSIASAIVFAKLQKALGIDAVAYKLGEVNKETKYALKTFEVEEPQTLTSVDENCDVALVDNNEFSQSVSGIEKAHVKMVVDHHKIKLETVEPIYFITEPLGCTCTILYKLYYLFSYPYTPLFFLLKIVLHKLIIPNKNTPILITMISISITLVIPTAAVAILDNGISPAGSKAFSPIIHFIMNAISTPAKPVTI